MIGNLAAEPFGFLDELEPGCLRVEPTPDEQRNQECSQCRPEGNTADIRHRDLIFAADRANDQGAQKRKECDERKKWSLKHQCAPANM